MAKQIYDTYVLTGLDEVIEDTVTEMVVRDMTPADRRYKYKGLYVNAKISKNPEKYSDQLLVRLGRGQLTDETWSIEISDVIDKFAK